MVLTGNLHVATSGKRPGTPRSLRATCHGFCHKNEKNNVLTPSGLICAQGRPDKRDSVWCPAPVYCTGGLTASKQMTPPRHFREMLMLLFVFLRLTGSDCGSDQGLKQCWLDFSNPSYITRWSAGFSVAFLHPWITYNQEASVSCCTVYQITFLDLTHAN